MKVKCPHCNSHNVVYWEEVVLTKEYQLKPNGKPYKRVKNREESYLDGNFGYKCLDCESWVNIYQEGPEAWQTE